MCFSGKQQTHKIKPACFQKLYFLNLTVKIHRRRRFKFKDSKCAWTAFIHAAALIYGRRKVLGCTCFRNAP